MNIYTVLWEDRHCDPTVHLFSDKDSAIDWAKAKAHEYARGQGVEESSRGCLYSVYYGEGSGLTVDEAIVDEELLV